MTRSARVFATLTLAVFWVISSGADDAPSTESRPVPVDASKVKPLKVGERVPSLTLRRPNGKPAKLTELLDETPTLLIFYRGGWCPYCDQQLGHLKTAHDEIVRLGYQVVAVSPDKPEELKKSIAKQKLDYTVLSDSNLVAAKALGVAFQVDQETLQKYQTYGIDLLKASGGLSGNILPVPSLFIVGTDRRVRFVHAEPDYTNRLKPEQLVEAATKAMEQ